MSVDFGFVSFVLSPLFNDNFPCEVLKAVQRKPPSTTKSPIIGGLAKPNRVFYNAHDCLLQAYVDVSHQTLVGIKLFDWDRTGDHDALGR